MKADIRPLNFEVLFGCVWQFLDVNFNHVGNSCEDGVMNGEGVFCADADVPI